MRERDIFLVKGMGDALARDYPENITDEEMLRKQMKSHHKQIFRRPTEEELKAAYADGKVDLDDMTVDQKKIIKAGVSSKIAEMRALSEQMKEEIEEEEIEEEKEEEIEKVKKIENIELEEEEVEKVKKNK
jgi:DNA mismatch repair ATPase MutS